MRLDEAVARTINDRMRRQRRRDEDRVLCDLIVRAQWVLAIARAQQ